MKKSSARIPCACDRRNSAHPGPALRGAWPDPGVLENLPHRRRRHDDAERREFAVDAAVAPRLILAGQSQHHRPNITARRRTSGATAARQSRPAAADDVAMPPQDRGGGDDQPHRSQPVGWQRPGEQSQPRPVRPRQPRMNARPLAQGDSKLMAQHQDLGVLPPRLPTGQAQHRHGTGDNEEDQLQAHKPEIIARPLAYKPRTNRHARALTPQHPGRKRPGDISFRHPQPAGPPRTGLAVRAGSRPAPGAARDRQWRALPSSHVRTRELFVATDR